MTLRDALDQATESLTRVGAALRAISGQPLRLQVENRPTRDRDLAEALLRAQHPRTVQALKRKLRV